MKHTDETVEKKARELYNEGAFHNHDKWLYADKEEKEKWKKIARQKLEEEGE